MGKQIIFLTLSAVLCMVLVGCGGVKFTNQTVSSLSLPDAYVKRTYVTGLSGLSEDISLVSGYLFRKEKTDTDTNLRLIKRFTIGGKPGIVNTLATSQGVIYDVKMTATASFNGSYLIAGIKANYGEGYELIIRDVAVSNLPDSLIDYSTLANFVKNLKQDELSSLFLAVSSEETLISKMQFDSTSADASVNGGTVFGAKGQAYLENSNFSVDKVISADLICLSDLFPATTASRELIDLRKQTDKARLKLTPTQQEYKINASKPMMTDDELRALGYNVY
jgi:hypothetical protein